MKRLLFIAVGILVPVSAGAVSITDPQYGWSCNGFLYCGTGGNAVTAITGNIIAGVSAFIVALAVVMFFYGGLRMVASRGEEGKEAGKKALMYAAFGLIAALLTAAVISFVRDYIYLLG